MPVLISGQTSGGQIFYGSFVTPSDTSTQLPLDLGGTPRMLVVSQEKNMNWTSSMARDVMMFGGIAGESTDINYLNTNNKITITLTTTGFHVKVRNDAVGRTLYYFAIM